MTLSVRQAERRLMSEIRTAVGRLPFLHITSEILVHEHAPPGSPLCPCCGVEFARVARRIPDAEVLVARSTGRRFTPGRLSPALWSRAIEVAEHHAIKLRVSEAQLPLLLDDTDRHLLVAGANRAGKTTLGLYWLARQWIRRGGKRRRLWLVGQSQEKAFELLRQLFEGDGRTPGILPPELAAKRPGTHRAADLNTILADGTIVQLRFFGGQTTAENLKSRPIVAALVDEAAEMRHRNALTALTGRCVDLRGRLFLASTPTPSSFLKLDVVDQVAEWDRIPLDHAPRQTGAHPGARWVSASLSMIENPWVDAEYVRKVVAAGNPEDPSFQRDVLGKWVTGAGRLWRFDAERDSFAHEARHVRDMLSTVERRAGCRQVRVTDVVARRLFQVRPNPAYRGLRATSTAYILGGDVNVSPQSTVVLEITADATDRTNRDKWHVWVIDVVRTYKGHSLAHAEYLTDTVWTRKWDSTATASPYKGCGIILDPSSFGRDPTAHRFGGDPRGIAEVFGDVGLDARAPQYDPSGVKPISLGRRDSHQLLHRLIDERRLHVNSRAQALITSLCEQEAGPDALQPLVVSHSKADRLASPVDALRYALWAIIHGGPDRPNTGDAQS